MRRTRGLQFLLAVVALAALVPELARAQTTSVPEVVPDPAPLCASATSQADLRATVQQITAQVPAATASPEALALVAELEATADARDAAIRTGACDVSALDQKITDLGIQLQQALATAPPPATSPAPAPYTTGAPSDVASSPPSTGSGGAVETFSQLIDVVGRLFQMVQSSGLLPTGGATGGYQGTPAFSPPPSSIADSGVGFAPPAPPPAVDVSAPPPPPFAPQPAGPGVGAPPPPPVPPPTAGGTAPPPQSPPPQSPPPPPVVGGAPAPGSPSGTPRPARPGLIRGRVLADTDGRPGAERPLVGAAVLISDGEPGTADRRVLTNAHGLFAIAGLRAGRYSVVATAEGFRGARAAVMLSAGQIENVSLTLQRQVGASPFRPAVPGHVGATPVLPGIPGPITARPPGAVERPGLIRGRVLADLDGRPGGERPLGGATVLISDGNGARDRRVTTDAQGLFAVAGLAAGRYSIVVTSAGFRSTNAAVSLSPGEAETVSLTLQRQAAAAPSPPPRFPGQIQPLRPRTQSP